MIEIYRGYSIVDAHSMYIVYSPDGEPTTAFDTIDKALMWIDQQTRTRRITLVSVNGKRVAI